jgi:hypothetical protein
MLKDARAPWLEELIDNRLALARTTIDHMKLAVSVSGRPDTFAMAVGIGEFWKQYVAYPGVQLSELLATVAETLGPGVGVGELRRLVCWATPRLTNTPFWTAIAVLNEYVELPYSNLSLNIHEFSVVAGVVDELRGLS